MHTTTETAHHPRPERSRSFGSGPLGRVVDGTLAALGVTAVLGTAALLLAWHGLGIVPMAVRSGSMEPTIPVGSLVFVEQVDPASVREGDVITFDPPGRVPRTTHRVVEREQRGARWYFTTKGDANGSIDDWRSGSAGEAGPGVTYGRRDAVRVRFHVPWLGHPVRLAGVRGAREALAGIVLLPIAAWMFARIWAPLPCRQGTTDAASAGTVVELWWPDEHQDAEPVEQVPEPVTERAAA